MAAVQVPIDMSHGGHCAAFPSICEIKTARKSLTFAGVAVHGNVTIIVLDASPESSAGANAFEASDVAVKTGERLLFFAKMSDGQVHVGQLTTR